MYPTKHLEAQYLYASIRAAGNNLMVMVSKEYTQHFKSVPKDGNTYIVQDPLHPRVHHMTRADGSYVRLDGKQVSNGLASTVKLDIRIKGRPRKVGKKPFRLVSQISSDVAIHQQPDSPPEISLIDINRVMRISGFGRSFIHAHPSFPAPVRLGTSRRAASRWIESEVVRWVKDLTAQRSIAHA
jgi:predicted DNA-binding transcriptional regulator AlpA